MDAGRQFPLHAREGLADLINHGERIGRRRRIDTDEHRLQSVEDGGGIRALRSEFDTGDVAEAHERVAARDDHELCESAGAVERGEGVDRSLRVVRFDLAGRRGEIVGRERPADVARGDAARGHLGRVEPDAHGEGLAAENLGFRDAVERLQLRLHHTIEIIGDLRAREHIRIEGHVEEGVALAGLLHDHRILRLARQLALHLLDFRQDVGDRAIGARVQPHVERDGRDVLLGTGDQRVDALGARHGLFERRGDEALDEVGVGARIGRRDGDRGLRQFRILPDLQLEARLRADEQDQQADDGRQNRAADEEVGERAHASGLTASAWGSSAEGPPSGRCARACREIA